MEESKERRLNIILGHRHKQQMSQVNPTDCLTIRYIKLFIIHDNKCLLQNMLDPTLVFITKEIYKLGWYMLGHKMEYCAGKTQPKYRS